MAERQIWHGLSVKDVEQRLNTPGSESFLVRWVHQWAMESLARHPSRPSADRYIPMGSLDLREIERITAGQWGWHPLDTLWSKVPIGGFLGRQWGLLLKSQIPQTNLRADIGVWIPEPPNQGLYAIHSAPESAAFGSPDTAVKIAVIANAMWAHALEQNGRWDILSEWGIRSRRDYSIRDPLAPLYDPLPKVFAQLAA